MMAPFSRTTLISTRVLSVLISIVPLVLFVSFFVKLSTYWDTHSFAASALPIVSLIVTMMWNILIMILMFTRTNISRWVYLSFELTITFFLIVLGSYATGNNCYYYLRLDSWVWGFSGGDGRDWFGEQVAAFSLLGVVAMLQILITILSIWGRGDSTRVDRGLIPIDLPTYDERFERTERAESTDEHPEEKSIGSFESLQKEDKNKFAESYS